MRHNLFLAILFILAGCSAFRPPVQPQAKLDADSYLQFALQMESSGDLKAAAEGFETAFLQYRGIGEKAGQLVSRSGIARIALAQGDLQSYNAELEKMSDFAALHGENLDCYPLLLKIHKLMNEKDYISVSRTAMTRSDYPKEAILQIKIAKLQADSYLKQATGSQAIELERLANEHLKQLKKRKSANPELLSSAWYALAYYHFSRGNHGKAQGLAEKAADWDYRFGDFSAYAHSLWLMAQIATAKKDTSNANSYYDRALGIFETLKDHAALEAINRERSQLKGE